MPGQHDGHRARLRAAAENDPELSSFSDFQTLEYLLSFVIPRKDTNSIAHALIEEFGSFNGVFHASKQELFDIPNMTNNAAAFLASFNAFVRKSELSRLKPKPIISNLYQAVETLAPYFIERNEERAYLAALDINDRVLQVSHISEGLSNYTTLDTNRVVSIVTRTKAKKIILAHNHPAGNLQPSNQDVEATTALFFILQTLNTILSDHIIFTNEGYFSFYKNGLLDELYMRSNKIFGIDNSEEYKLLRSNGVYMYETKFSGSKE